MSAKNVFVFLDGSPKTRRAFFTQSGSKEGGGRMSKENKRCNWGAGAACLWPLGAGATLRRKKGTGANREPEPQ